MSADRKTLRDGSKALEDRVVRVRWSGGDGFVRYAFDWLGFIYGVRFELIFVGMGDVAYGDEGNATAKIIMSHRTYSVADPPPGDISTEKRGQISVINVDLIEALRFYLTDVAHKQLNDDAYDDHDRLKFSNSIFQRLNLGTRPVVNEYVVAFGQLLETELGISVETLWPNRKRACVVLTHDVDDPLDASVSNYGRLDPRRLFSSVRGGGDKNRNWLFEDIMREESAYGFRSTFYFATRHRQMTEASERFDVNYDVSDAAFARLFDRLHCGGFEIGLHASYRAFEIDGGIANERDRLVRAAGATVRGNRHHYWRMGRNFWPTLTQHSEAGLSYDSSLAFNDAPGFRMGVALPFQPWSPISNELIPVWQFPTMLMDGAVFYREDATVEEGVACFQALLSQLIATGGIGALDWHVRTSFPGNARYRHWGTAYLSILEALADRNDVWVATGSAVLEHLEARRVRLSKQFADHDDQDKRASRPRAAVC